MAWTSDDLATIDAAIASGIREIQYQDRKVIYPSIDDLKAARTEIAAYLSQQANGQKPVRMVRVYTRNGW